MAVVKKEKKFVSKYTDLVPLRTFQGAKQGLTQQEIATSVGVDLTTFKNWLKKKDSVKKAFKEGREKRCGVKDFHSYVYGRLPRELQKVWSRINKFETHRNAKEKIESLLEKQGKSMRQHLFLYALVDSNFTMSEAMRKICLSPCTLVEWKKDPEFTEILKKVDEWKGDFFEGSLINLVKSGDSAAILFANRTYNRKRGYSDKIEIESKVEVSHSFSLDRLPLEMRRAILEDIKARGELEDFDEISMTGVEDEEGKTIFKTREEMSRLEHKEEV